MNKVILIGRTSRDVDLVQLSNGDMKATFTIAVQGYGENADFFELVAWKKQAETIAKYVEKGDRIAVIGRLERNSYTTRDGEKKTSYNVRVDEIEFLTTKREKEEERAEAVEELKEGVKKAKDEDLPF